MCKIYGNRLELFNRKTDKIYTCICACATHTQISKTINESSFCAFPIRKPFSEFKTHSHESYHIMFGLV